MATQPYTHIVHLADIHLRAGNAAQARSDEYLHVFENLTNALTALPCIREKRALVVVCGDIFHHKYKLESITVRLWNRFLQAITDLAPVVLICGNHDLRQEDEESPDLIDVLLEQLPTTKHPCVYLKDTGTTSFQNVHVGLVRIRDTLRARDTCGLVKELPPFPTAPQTVGQHDVSVALFHGTLTQSALPNGMRLTAGHGYPLEWFAGYDLLLLGDNHKQQHHPGAGHLPAWGYPGSLVQQDLGEPVFGHGFLVWDLAKRACTPHHVPNDYGRFRIKHTDGVVLAKLGTQYEPLDDAVMRHARHFPQKPHVVVMGNSTDEAHAKTCMRGLDIHPSYLATTLQVESSSNTADGDAHGDVGNLLDDVAQLHHASKWLDYVRTMEPSLADTVVAHRWLEAPATLLMEPLTDAKMSADLRNKVDERRERVQKALDVYARTSQEGMQRSKVVLNYLSWSWSFSYGEYNWFDFRKMTGNIAVLNGANATGKSSFIDTLCISLFGEPNPYRNLNSLSKRMSVHFLHHQRPTRATMKTWVVFEKDDKHYGIHRIYTPHKNTAAIEAVTCELYSLDGPTREATTRTLVCSGVPMVDAWVQRHIGRLDDVMRTTVVSQVDQQNFFTLKPADQKERLDEALNMEALQSFGEVLHQAILGYNALLDTLGTVVQTLDTGLETAIGVERGDMVSVASGEEEGIESHRPTQEAAVAHWTAEKLKLETLRDRLATMVGSYVPADSYVPVQEDYQENEDDAHSMQHRAAMAHERQTLLPTLAMEPDDTWPIDDAIAIRNGLQLALNQKQEWTSTMPPVPRAKEAWQRDWDALNEWCTKHDASIQELVSGALERRWKGQCATLREAVGQYEKDLDGWSKVQWRALETSWKATVGTFGDDDDDVCENARDALDAAWAHHDALRVPYDDAQQRLQASQPCRDEAAWDAWQAEWHVWQERCAEADEAAWPDMDACEQHALAAEKCLQRHAEWTKDAEGTRTTLDQEHQTMTSLQKEHAALRTQWKAHQEVLATCPPALDAYAAVDAALVLRRALEHERGQCDREEATLKEAWAALERDGWTAEWAAWTSKLQRAVKQGWTDLAVVHAEWTSATEDVQRWAVLESLKTSLDAEWATLEHVVFNASCAACRANPMRQRREAVGVQREAIHAEQEALDSLEACQKRRAYWQKACETLRPLDEQRPRMNARHQERMDAEARLNARRDEWVAHRDAVQHALDASLDVAALETYKASHWFMETHSVLRKEQKRRLTEWTDRMEATGGRLKKLERSIKKLGEYEALEESHAYWRRGAEMQRWLDDRRDPMTEEQDAWKRAQREWHQRRTLVATCEVRRVAYATACDDVVAAHAKARHMWTLSGRKTRRHLQEAHETMQHVRPWLDSVPEHKAKKRTLDEERAQYEAWVAWNASAESMDADIHQWEWCAAKVRDRELVAELALLDARADRVWQAWQTTKERFGAVEKRREDAQRHLERCDRAAWMRQEHTSLAGRYEAYRTVWQTTRDALSALHGRLIGGVVGIKAKAKTGDANETATTFKEWVYRHHVLPLLERQLNNFLAPIEPLAVRVAYKPKGLEFVVMDRGNETSFAASSGYQQFLINLAMRQALTSLGGRGNNLRHMFIDEGFTACDTANLDKAHAILKRLIEMGGYESILLVSHLDAIKDVVPLKIHVKREGAFSQLRYGDRWDVALTFQNEAAKEAGAPSASGRGRPKKKAV